MGFNSVFKGLKLNESMPKILDTKNPLFASNKLNDGLFTHVTSV